MASDSNTLLASIRNKIELNPIPPSTGWNQSIYDSHVTTPVRNRVNANLDEHTAFSDTKIANFPARGQGA